MFHWAALRAFVYATEDRDKVIQAMENLGLKGELKSSKAEGAYGDRIEIIEVRAKKNSDIKEFLSNLGKDIIARILENLDERTDDEGILHFRADKQSAYDGIVKISNGGDVIAVEMKIEVYPFSRERAIESAKKYLEGLL